MPRSDGAETSQRPPARVNEDRTSIHSSGKLEIDELADEKSIPVFDPDVQLDAGYLNKLTEPSMVI
jgi:hypothetical protein